MSSDTCSYLEDYLKELREASILLVGAGGIGCEVIKNLTLSGARKVTIVDMDTVDISNLNRQFLYNRNNVKQYKAEVARSRVLEVLPDCEIKAIVCDVTGWNPKDVENYDAVLNALDNIRARSHINYCCVHAGVPLIESGSTGFNGQVFPILRNLTKCYDCDAKPESKSIPVCTIRQIPEKPEHCIAWARNLYELLFGTPDPGNILSDLAVPKFLVGKNITEEVVISYISDLFNFLFSSEIEILISLKDVWVTREPPRAIKYPFDRTFSASTNDKRKNCSAEAEDEIAPKIRKTKECCDSYASESGEFLHSDPSFSGSVSSGVVDSQAICKDIPQPIGIEEKQKKSSIEELSEQFRDSIKHIFLRTPQIIGQAAFHKDDDVCLKFVAASANLRMINFNIPHLSTWDVQSIAGSIVPAIAATNAIVAASQVVQLIHILRLKRRPDRSISEEDFQNSKCRFIWIRSNVIGSMPLLKGNISHPERLEPPNPNCLICQQRAVRVILNDIGSWTLDRFVANICRDSLKLEMVNIDFNMRNIYDCEEFQDNEEYATSIRKNSMAFYGITDASVLTVTDLNSSNQQFEIIINTSSEIAGRKDFKIFGC